MYSNKLLFWKNEQFVRVVTGEHLYASISCWHCRNTQIILPRNNFVFQNLNQTKEFSYPDNLKNENSLYETKIVTIQSFQKWGTHQNHNKARESVLSLWIKSCAVKINCSLVVSLKYLKLNFLSSSKIPNKTMLDLRQCSGFPQQVSCK